MSLVRIVALGAWFAIAVAWLNGEASSWIVLAVVGLSLGLVGFTLIDRIVGEGSEQPPAWRYRDRR